VRHHQHTPDAVDLTEVRTLLLRCQHYVDQVTTTLSEATVTLSGERVTRLVDEAVTPDLP